jgi:molybdopterin converting factor small subunit
MNPMNDIQVEIKLFGGLRRYHTESVLTLRVPCSSRVDAVKQKMGEIMQAAHGGAFDLALLAQSVLANDQTILTDDTLLVQDSKLAVLPPVCGG